MSVATPRFGSHLKVSPTLALTPSKFVPTIKTDKSRIGILRRPEGVSPTLDSGTFIAQTPDVGSVNVEHHQESNIDLYASPEKSIHNTSREERMQHNYELKVPETGPLKSSLLHEFSSGQFHKQSHDDNKVHSTEDAPEKPKEIPFWLRPTPVQPYPYNFIMAVRKKLESITNPVFSPKQRKEQPTYRSSVARPDSHFVSHFRRNLEKRRSESDKSMSENVKSSDVSPVKSVNPNESSLEQQEYSMDFSSAVESQHDNSQSQEDQSESKNNRSEMISKSKRKSVQASQDTLSISSGILSHSSPKKKMRTSTSGVAEKSALVNRRSTLKSVQRDEERPPSPLTTDNVDALHITSRSHEGERMSSARSVSSRQSVTSSITSLINFGRGRDFEARSQPSFNKLSKQQDIKVLLHDFKASLTTAIKTNELLHELISNPPSSRSKYSDDFERTSENRQSHISEHISESRENRENGSSDLVPSYKSQYTADVPQSNGQSIESKIGTENQTVPNSTTEIHSIELSRTHKERSQSYQSNLSTSTKMVDDCSTKVSNEINTTLNSSSKQGDTFSNQVDDISAREERNISIENDETVEDKEKDGNDDSSRTLKRSSTLIEEKIDEYQSSESPTNNDLKSVSLSIAKKSAPTSDDTDQPSHATKSFNKQIIGEPEVANESIGSDIFAIFNKTAFSKDELNTSLWSEHNVSYSTLGMVRFFNYSLRCFFNFSNFFLSN